MLCSDGLTGQVTDWGIREVLNREFFANARCQALIGAANTAGGSDNTTVVVASYDDYAGRNKLLTH